MACSCVFGLAGPSVTAIAVLASLFIGYALRGPLPPSSGRLETASTYVTLPKCPTIPECTECTVNSKCPECPAAMPSLECPVSPQCSKCSNVDGETVRQLESNLTQTKLKLDNVAQKEKRCQQLLNSSFEDCRAIQTVAGIEKDMCETKLSKCIEDKGSAESEFEATLSKLRKENLAEVERVIELQKEEKRTFSAEQASAVVKIDTLEKEKDQLKARSEKCLSEKDACLAGDKRCVDAEVERLQNQIKILDAEKYESLTANGELKKELYQCEQDRSLYNIRMQEAESEVATLRDERLKAG